MSQKKDTMKRIGLNQETTIEEVKGITNICMGYLSRWGNPFSGVRLNLFR